MTTNYTARKICLSASVVEREKEMRRTMAPVSIVLAAAILSMAVTQPTLAADCSAGSSKRSFDRLDSPGTDVSFSNDFGGKYDVTIRRDNSLKDSKEVGIGESIRFKASTRPNTEDWDMTVRIANPDMTGKDGKVPAAVCSYTVNVNSPDSHVWISKVSCRKVDEICTNCMLSCERGYNVNQSLFRVRLHLTPK
jgi:hypothetical protein